MCYFIYLFIGLSIYAFIDLYSTVFIHLSIYILICVYLYIYLFLCRESERKHLITTGNTEIKIIVTMIPVEIM